MRESDAPNRRDWTMKENGIERIEKYAKQKKRRRLKKSGCSRSRTRRAKGKSPRVFGPCLPSSFVPELRLFSWPSFSRFVHPWAQGRARERAKEKGGREREQERGSNYEGTRREGERNTMEEEEEG